MTTPAFSGEVQFRRWSDSSTQGVQVTFALPSSDELEPLKGKEGKRFMAVLVEIGDDELPVEPQKRKDTRGPLCREACDLCANGQFQRWIGVADMPRAELAAREWVIAKCRVLSRKQLDENPRAAELFKQEVRIPFFRFQKEASYGGWGE